VPFVRCVAVPGRLPDNSIVANTSFSVLDQLVEADGTTAPARAVLRPLAERVEAACVAFGTRLPPFLTPEAPERLGSAHADAVALACQGPTVRVSAAELAVLSLVAESFRARLTPVARRALGPIVDALGTDVGAAAPAPDLTPWLARAAAPEPPPG
jgi:hypothetical protein